MLKPLGEAIGDRISPQITLKKGGKGTFKAETSPRNSLANVLTLISPVKGCLEKEVPLLRQCACTT